MTGKSVLQSQLLARDPQQITLRDQPDFSLPIFARGSQRLQLVLQHVLPAAIHQLHFENGPAGIEHAEDQRHRYRAPTLGHFPIGRLHRRIDRRFAAAGRTELGVAAQ